MHATIFEILALAHDRVLVEPRQQLHAVGGDVEFYLVGTIGKPRVRSRSIRNLIAAPVREHSRKPDQLHADLEALYAGPYAELFARQRRPGWDAWGNDVDRFTS